MCPPSAGRWACPGSPTCMCISCRPGCCAGSGSTLTLPGHWWGRPGRSATAGRTSSASRTCGRSASWRTAPWPTRTAPAWPPISTHGPWNSHVSRRAACRRRRSTPNLASWTMSKQRSTPERASSRCICRWAASRLTSPGCGRSGGCWQRRVCRWWCTPGTRRWPRPTPARRRSRRCSLITPG